LVLLPIGLRLDLGLGHLNGKTEKTM